MKHKKMGDTSLEQNIKKYRKKPVVIEAVEWNGENYDDLTAFCGDEVSFDPKNGMVLIGTLEGLMNGKIGDYIIKGISGEFYPCKPDIFHKTYEQV